jgi:hypothetical protein
MGSATRWREGETRGSFSMDTPIGRAVVSKIAGDAGWSAQVETPSGTRASQPLATREEAEAWVEQQVAEGQRMVDDDPESSSAGLGKS